MSQAKLNFTGRVESSLCQNGICRSGGSSTHS